MTRDELKNGAIVKLRNGGMYLKVDNTLLELNGSGFTVLENFGTNLLSRFFKDFDVVAVDNDIGCTGENRCNRAWCKYKSGNMKWTWERDEDILDKEEREYLSAVIKPFRNRVRFIKKSVYNCGKSKRYYIAIIVNNYATVFSDLKTEKMYGGMEIGKEYTLEELGI